MRLFNNDTIEGVAVWLSGGIPAYIVSYELFVGVAVPMILACATGLLGGFFALIGKDIYKWAKIKLFNKVKDDSQ